MLSPAAVVVLLNIQTHFAVSYNYYPDVTVVMMVSLIVMMMMQSWEGIIPSCAIACSSHGAPEHKAILYGQLAHHDVMVVMTVSLIRAGGTRR